MLEMGTYKMSDGKTCRNNSTWGERRERETNDDITGVGRTYEAEKKLECCYRVESGVKTDVEKTTGRIVIMAIIVRSLSTRLGGHAAHSNKQLNKWVFLYIEWENG
jgi:hypothetical protein